MNIAVYYDHRWKHLWLNQAVYINKIIKLANIKQFNNEILMIKAELLSYDQQVLTKFIWNFQRKIESLLYAVIITWIDIIFVIFWLVRFLTNSSSEHHNAADHVLHYLYRHQSLTLKLDRADNFLVIMNISFVNNLIN